jgi:hypothetical protein
VIYGQGPGHCHRLLHEVQDAARDQERKADHHEEWPAGYGRNVPGVQHQNVQDRRQQVSPSKRAIRCPALLLQSGLSLAGRSQCPQNASPRWPIRLRQARCKMPLATHLQHGAHAGKTPRRAEGCRHAARPGTRRRTCTRVGPPFPPRQPVGAPRARHAATSAASGCAAAWSNP